MNRSHLADDAAGPHNAIVDVAGVSMGHVDIRTPDLHTGLTAIVPYPASVEERKLFIGRFSIDGGDAMSGLRGRRRFRHLFLAHCPCPDPGRWPGVRILNPPQLGPRHRAIDRSGLAASGGRD